MPANFNHIQQLADQDVDSLKESEKSYGDSWRSRGGVGAFMMLARKFDRVEHQSEKHGWDVFEAGAVYSGEAGLLDDVRDLRRYLLLVEQEILLQTENTTEVVKVDNNDDYVGSDTYEEE